MWDFHGMSDAQYPDLWSDNPNAPKISHHLYLLEKANLAGYLVASILYGMPRHSHLQAHLSALTHNRFILGILIELFFRCMIALLNPTNRKGRRIEWGLISYTIVMFSLATIQTAASLYILSLCYIDNRDFPGLDDMTHSGPVGYAVFLDHEALAIVPNIMIFLNGWLADGLLVSSPLILGSPAQVSNAGSPTALSLLQNLHHEPLGYRLPLPLVPWVVRYAFDFSTNR